MGRKGLVLEETCDSPALIPHRQAIQHGAVKSPGWHEEVHEGNEAGVVSGFQQVGDLMHDDVFETCAGFAEIPDSSIFASISIPAAA
jgi:hypothetical protein